MTRSNFSRIEKCSLTLQLVRKELEMLEQHWDLLICYFIYSSVYMWRRQWHPTPALLPGKSHGRRSLVGCSPWGLGELDTSERLHFHFSLSCIGEGNGYPLQCSCLENPRNGGAWWSAVYGVAQSRTRLKCLAAAAAAVCICQSQSPISPW